MNSSQQMNSVQMMDPTADYLSLTQEPTQQLNEYQGFYDIAGAIRLYYQPSVCFFGLTGNIWAFVILMQRNMRRKTTCMYMSAISVVDFIILVISFYWWLSRYVETDTAWSCKIVLFLFYFAGHSSVLLLVAMTTERFVAVRFPLRAATLITRTRTKRVIIVILTSMLILNFHNFFTRTAIVDEKTNSTSCLFSNSATLESEHGFFHVYLWPWIDSCIYSFMPLSTIAVLNLLIVNCLRQSSKARKSMNAAISTNPGHPKEGTQQTKSSKSNSEYQVTIMLLSITTAFLALTGPLAVTLIVEKFLDFQDPYVKASHKLLRAVVANLMYTNHAINFLLYVLTGEQFRQTLKEMCWHPQQREVGSKETLTISTSEAVTTNTHI